MDRCPDDRGAPAGTVDSTHATLWSCRASARAARWPRARQTARRLYDRPAPYTRVDFPAQLSRAAGRAHPRGGDVDVRPIWAQMESPRCALAHRKRCATMLGDRGHPPSGQACVSGISCVTTARRSKRGAALPSHARPQEGRSSREPATARFWTGRNTLPEPLYRASEPLEHASEPNPGLAHTESRQIATPYCPRARLAPERQNGAICGVFP